MDQELTVLKKNPAVETIIQFGSSLKRKDFRDIDICIITTKTLDFQEKLTLRSNLPEKYDLSFYDELPLRLKKVVLTEGKILFTRNYLRFLREIPYLEREYPRYALFLEEHYQQKMA